MRPTAIITALILAAAGAALLALTRPPAPAGNVAAFAAAVRPGQVLTSADITTAPATQTPAMIQPPEAAIGAIVLKAAPANAVIQRGDVLLPGDPGYALPFMTPQPEN